jgi:hypothetical protein
MEAETSSLQLLHHPPMDILSLYQMSMCIIPTTTTSTHRGLELPDLGR